MKVKDLKNALNNYDEDLEICVALREGARNSFAQFELDGFRYYMNEIFGVACDNCGSENHYRVFIKV